MKETQNFIKNLQNFIEQSRNSCEIHLLHSNYIL
jgi:hypothetical protein